MLSMSTRELTLAAVFMAMAFAVRSFNVLVIETPVPPLKMDVRGIPVFIGSILVSPWLAWLIGWAASQFDPIFGWGIDFIGWIPASIVCSLIWRKLEGTRVSYRVPLSIIGGQALGYSLFTVAFIGFYGVPDAGLYVFLTLLLGRMIGSLIVASIVGIPIVKFMENQYPDLLR